MTDFKRNLVQSADGAARVAVLLAAVILFAAIWESDASPGEDNWLARRAGAENATVAQQNPAPEGLTAGDAGGLRESDHQSRAKPQPVARSVSHSEESRLSQPAGMKYPLPAGIVAGDYTVVDCSGKVGTLHIPEDMASVGNTTGDRRIYETRDGGRVLYFIRITRSSGIAGLKRSAWLR